MRGPTLVHLLELLRRCRLQLGKAREARPPAARRCARRTWRIPSPYTSRASGARFDRSTLSTILRADFFPSLTGIGMRASCAAVKPIEVSRRPHQACVHQLAGEHVAHPLHAVPDEPPENPPESRIVGRRRRLGPHSPRGGLRHPPRAWRSVSPAPSRPAATSRSTSRRVGASAREAWTAAASRRLTPLTRAISSTAAAASAVRLPKSRASRSALRGLTPGMPSACTTRASVSSRCAPAMARTCLSAFFAPSSASFLFFERRELCHLQLVQVRQIPDQRPGRRLPAGTGRRNQPVDQPPRRGRRCPSRCGARSAGSIPSGAPCSSRRRNAPPPRLPRGPRAIRRPDTPAASRNGRRSGPASTTRTTFGMTSPLRITTTRSPICSPRPVDLLRVVQRGMRHGDAAHLHRLQDGARRHGAGPPDVHVDVPHEPSRPAARAACTQSPSAAPWRSRPTASAALRRRP